MNIIDVVEKESMKEKVPQFKIGDLVDVHVKTIEGDKERIQIFNGMVIKRKGSGPRETFTVRRVVQGEGVERIFPVHSPNVADVKVKKSHKTRRAKLYFLRDYIFSCIQTKISVSCVTNTLWCFDFKKPIRL